MQKKAFTLTELLVVISIVALLMGLLLPVLSRARQQTRSILCRSNLRQLVVAAGVYAGNNDDYYPIAQMGSKYEPPLFITLRWDFKIIKDWNTGEKKVKPGILWQGETMEKIQLCPSYEGNPLTDEVPYTGYNYNTSYIGHGKGEKTETPAKITQVCRPVDCAIFGDGGYYGGVNNFMRAPWPSDDDDFPARAAGTQSYRHMGKTNVAYCDGSVASTDKLYKETDPANAEKITPDTGFLSPDNSAYDLE
jgi:prepilin-type N-terminal cleavage/methylation domain-containing protein/prepilin-type processing-associated H-X9-DG protein